MLHGNYRSSSLKIPKSINNGTCQLAWYCFRRKRRKLEIYIQKEAKILFIYKKKLKPHNIVLVIFPIFLHPVEHDCTTPIKCCTNIKINVDRTKEKKSGGTYMHIG